MVDFNNVEKKITTLFTEIKEHLGLLHVLHTVPSHIWRLRHVAFS